jgi:putative SOS response-associated peptidase YedK
LLAANRCIVPASGFFEWRAEPRGKTPYDIYPTSHQFLAFAGLYDIWTNPAGEELYAFTVITKDADEFMAQLHNRMPVILDRDLEDAWLDNEITSTNEVLDILKRSADVTLDAYPVSRIVNKPSGDREFLIQSVGCASRVLDWSAAFDLRSRHSDAIREIQRVERYAFRDLLEMKLSHGGTDSVRCGWKWE